MIRKNLQDFVPIPTPFEKSFVKIPSFVKPHIASFLRGIPMFVVVAMLSGEVVMLFGR